MRISLIAACIAGIGLTGCSTPAPPPAAAEYDPATGRLRLLAQDADGNGTPETFVHLDGTRLLRIEHDLDGDGNIDRWDFFTDERVVEKVGLSSRNDGVMDWQAYYAPDGALLRLAVSTRRDGTFDRTEFYSEGALVRSEEDTDGDGRPDKWDTYRPVADGAPGEPAYAITSTAFDENGSGRPDRRFVYAPDGSIARVDVLSDGSGDPTR